MAYTDNAKLKKYMGLNWDATLDSFVTSVIAGVQKYIERYCGDDKIGVRKFEAPNPDEDQIRKFDGNGDARLYFGDVQEITSLTVDEVSLTEDEDYFLYPANKEADEPYTYAEMAQPVTRLQANSRSIGDEYYAFEVGQKNIVVTGKFYYSATVPADIELATLKLASAIIKENVSDKDVKELKSESLGDYSVSYQDVDKIAGSLKVTDLLAGYVRKASDGASHSKTSGAVSAGVIRV